MKVRADQLLVTRGLAPSRARAQALVLAGKVYVGEARIDKAGALLAGRRRDRACAARIIRYVSRGGVKLAGALDTFGVDPRGKRCIDLGASTGGFTDCLLQRGAASVAAVDVGYGQLAHKLRIDPRVLVLERTNARTLEPDAGRRRSPTSSSSTRRSSASASCSPAIARCLAPGGELVALVKPQFEVGREEASRSKGVVRDPEVRARGHRRRARATSRGAGLEVLGTCDSTLEGPKGNLEAFVHARKP